MQAQQSGRAGLDGGRAALGRCRRRRRLPQARPGSAPGRRHGDARTAHLVPVSAASTLTSDTLAGLRRHLAGGRAAGAADDSTSGRAAGVAGAVGARLSHPPNRVCPMHDPSNPTGASALDPAGPATDPAGAAWGVAVPEGGVDGQGPGFCWQVREARFTLISHGFREQTLKVSHPSDRVLDMNDLSNPSEASAPDSPSPVADQTDRTVGSAGPSADPAGEAGCRAADAEGLTLPAGGRAMLGDGLAGGRAAGVADGPCGAVGQPRQHQSRSEFTNRCDCHIMRIGCAA